MLFGVKRELLARMLLPVGEFEKPAIRRLAAGLGLNVADEEGQPGDLLRHPRAVRRVRASDRERDAATSDSARLDVAASSCSPTARSSASTAASKASPSASARGSASRSATPKFVVRIEPETRRVVLGDREELGPQRTDGGATATGWSIAADAAGAVRGADSLQRAAGGGARAISTATGGCTFASTNRSSASRRGRRSSATTASACWAAGGSSEASRCSESAFGMLSLRRMRAHSPEYEVRTIRIRLRLFLLLALALGELGGGVPDDDRQRHENQAGANAVRRGARASSASIGQVSRRTA